MPRTSVRITKRHTGHCTIYLDEADTLALAASLMSTRSLGWKTGSPETNARLERITLAFANTVWPIPAQPAALRDSQPSALNSQPS